MKIKSALKLLIMPLVAIMASCDSDEVIGNVYSVTFESSDSSDTYFSTPENLEAFERSVGISAYKNDGYNCIDMLDVSQFAGRKGYYVADYTLKYTDRSGQDKQLSKSDLIKNNINNDPTIKETNLKAIERFSERVRSDIVISVDFEKIDFTLSIDAGLGSVSFESVADKDAYTSISDSKCFRTFEIGDGNLELPSAERFGYKVSSNAWTDGDDLYYFGNGKTFDSDGFINKSNVSITSSSQSSAYLNRNDLSKPEFAYNTLSLTCDYISNTYDAEIEYYDIDTNEKIPFEASPSEISFSYENGITLADPAVAGYTCDHWEYVYGKKSEIIIPAGESSVTVNPTEANFSDSKVWLRCYLKKITYSISYRIEYNGELYELSDDDFAPLIADGYVSSLPTDFTVVTGDLEIPALSISGYSISSGWHFADTSDEYSGRLYGVAEDITLVTSLEIQPYEIRYSTSTITAGSAQMSEFEEKYNRSGDYDHYDVRTEKTLCSEKILGYILTGWEVNGKFHSVSSGFTLEPKKFTGDITVTAVFEKETCEITCYDKQTVANASRLLNKYVYDIDSDYDVPKPEAVTGYTPVGWISQDSQIYNDSYHVDGQSLFKNGTGNFELYARYDLIEYTVSFAVEGIGLADRETSILNSIISANRSEYTIVDDTFSVTASDYLNEYRFTGWKNNLNTVSKGSHENVVFTAVYEPIQYTITLKDEATGKTSSKKYSVETSGNLTDFGFSRTGYKFDKWTIRTESGETEVKAYSDLQLKDCTLYANWAMIGEGQSGSPYEIYNISQLKAIPQLCSADEKTYFKLMNSITISESDGWTPLDLNGLAVDLDGNGNGIRYSLENLEAQKFGLFDTLTAGSTVHDLILNGTIGENEESGTDGYAEIDEFGGIAVTSKGQITNCESNMSIFQTEYSSSAVVKGGHFVGTMKKAGTSDGNETLVDSCTVKSGTYYTIVTNSSDMKFGGIAGYGQGGEIRDCAFYGSIAGQTLSSDGNPAIGGILGQRSLSTGTSICATSLDKANAYYSASTATVKSTSADGTVVRFPILGKSLADKTTSLTGVTYIANYYYFVVVENTSSENQLMMVWEKYTGTTFDSTGWAQIYLSGYGLKAGDFDYMYSSGSVPEESN